MTCLRLVTQAEKMRFSLFEHTGLQMFDWILRAYGDFSVIASVERKELSVPHLNTVCLIYWFHGVKVSHDKFYYRIPKKLDLYTLMKGNTNMWTLYMFTVYMSGWQVRKSTMLKLLYILLVHLPHSDFLHEKTQDLNRNHLTSILLNSLS